MIKCYGEAPKPGQTYTRRPGVYAILVRNRAVLVTHQAKPQPEIQLPGGGIDAGEHPIAALHREVFEETGWHMTLHFRLGAFRRFTYMPEYDLWAEKLCTIYVGRPTLRISAPTEPFHSPLWLPLSGAAPALGNPGDRAMMENFIKRVQ
ncbi:NUDIX hydrolase [Pseudorhodobacter sp.]|uniref:NUDIX hydrolase n=1 Tax=Pseudorhodobacter sp. TaxID=1934400 RepID=UPI002AFFDEF2|nr:NUDIX hydrolase [Pseudorhodobacter sp.]